MERGCAQEKKKKDCVRILETELCSDSLTLTKLDSCRQCVRLGEKRMNLPRYLDSIVDCNRATCSQRVYAKIFIYKYI